MFVPIDVTRVGQLLALVLEDLVEFRIGMSEGSDGYTCGKVEIVSLGRVGEGETGAFREEDRGSSVGVE